MKVICDHANTEHCKQIQKRIIKATNYAYFCHSFPHDLTVCHLHGECDNIEVKCIPIKEVSQ